MRDFREGPRELREKYCELLTSGRSFHLSTEARKIIERITGIYDDAKPLTEKMMHRSAAAELSDEEFISREREYLERSYEIEARYYELRTLKARVTKVWTRIRGKPLPPAVPYEKQVNVGPLAKQRGFSLIELFAGEFPNTKYLQQRYEQMILTRRRHAFYKTLCAQPKFGKQQYIFLPLMFQPERTSCPQGGIFSNQILMLNLLANLVPHGWHVYVKEHPTQFHPNMQNNQARSKEFYQAIASFDNVKLIDTAIDPFSLIDNAKAVATVGGTAALEAVLRGKPAIVFGYTYFNDCAGIYPVTSEYEVREAITNIGRGVTIDRRDVERYFSAIEISMFKGNADANLLTMEIDQNAPNIATEILRQIDKMGLRPSDKTHRQDF